LLLGFFARKRGTGILNLLIRKEEKTRRKTAMHQICQKFEQQQYNKLTKARESL